MSNEVEFNSLTKDDVKIRFEDPSGIPSKPTDEEVAKHRKTRLILVVFFAIAVVAMVAVAVIIIIVAPRCEKAEEVKEKGKGNEKGNATLKGNDTIDENWWKNAVIYQVYPLSFKDSNDTGYGDLKGIAEKMDYFTELGVNALGLSPIYQSPMADGGYDISNYTAIDKTFGTMEEFEEFLKESHEKGFKIIMEFVPNHSSNKHPWFEESKKSKDNKFRDYYIWRDGTGVAKNQTPNNWISVFGGSAWTYDDTTDQYYLHQFHKEQPDLNLRNDEVKHELKKVLKFWLDKGVDGFRVNAAQFLLEDESFNDEPENSNYNNMSDPTYDMLDHTLTYGKKVKL